MEKYNWLFDVILRLSEALVRFRASGDQFCALSSEVFAFHLRLSEALVCFRASGDNFLRSFF